MLKGAHLMKKQSEKNPSIMDRVIRNNLPYKFAVTYMQNFPESVCHVLEWTFCKNKDIIKSGLMWHANLSKQTNLNHHFILANSV